MENGKIKKNLSYLNNFIGYGDSDKATVFHIAIDEKLDKVSEQDGSFEFIKSEDKILITLIN